MMKDLNALPVKNTNELIDSKITAENINYHTTKERSQAVSNVHERECCVNYEQSDMTLIQENL
jgi:hypothetical protein